MESLSFHVQDIAENAIRAGAQRVEIKIVESTREDSLMIEIVHDGPGYSNITRDDGGDSGARTDAVRKAGLGTYKLTGAAKKADGDWSVGLSPMGDTRICVSFRLSHTDRKPLGNIEEAFQTLAARYAEIEFRLEYTTEDTTRTWDTAAAEDLAKTRLPTRIQNIENNAG